MQKIKNEGYAFLIFDTVSKSLTFYFKMCEHVSRNFDNSTISIFYLSNFVHPQYSKVCHVYSV